MMPNPRTLMLALQNRAVQAAWQARTPAETRAVQQDIVTGARRLVELCEAQHANSAMLAAAREYLAGAEEALARLEAPARLEGGQ